MSPEFDSPSPRKPNQTPGRRTWLLMLTLLGAGATTSTLLGLLGSLWWGFELLDHPRFQYCLVLEIALLAGIAARQKIWLLWLLPLGVNLALMAPLAWPTTGLGEVVNDRPLTLLHLNLGRHLDQNSQAIKRTVTYLDRQTVDILSLQEVTPAWLVALQARLTRYEPVFVVPRSNSHGSALFLPRSPRIPLTVQATQIIHLPEFSPRPLLETVFQLDDRPFVLLNLHLTRSRNPGTSQFQQTELNEVAKWSQTQQQQGIPTLILGDFNSTPWSGRMRRLLHQGNLQNSQQGYLWQTTWPAGWPAPLRIAIDHGLHSSEWQVISRGSDPALDSDHLPLRLTLVMKS